ncbi:RHS repeat-associated core domain-containing protein [Lacrimispora algidixylanolytica]|nr:RHS repeat-associated core domain-containing protein [Lacrimispora algidixylanolytica]
MGEEFHLENFYDGEFLRAGTSVNGNVSRFVYYNGELQAETDEDESVSTRYILGYGVAGIERNDVAGLHTYHLDEQNSTSYVTGASGEIESFYEYDAFGAIRRKSEEIKNRILYTGQQYDQETGQYYLRARFYNPVVGRFFQEDVYRGDGLNLYAYCGNNPVNYYDPSGYMKKTQNSQNCKDDDKTTTKDSGDNNTVPTDTYVFGNATKPGDARPGKDFGVESGSDVVNAQSPPLPKGKSVCADPYDTPLTGTIYKVPEGTKLPEGLSIVYDGKDKVPGGHAIGHSTIYPTRDITVDEFNGLYQSMPWEKGEKKR